MKRTKLVAFASVILICVMSFGLYVGWESLFQSKNFRTYNSAAHHKRILSKNFTHCLSLPRKLDDDFPFSGGGRINFSQMDRMNTAFPGRILVVNLRRDEGFYHNRQPISNYGLHFRDNEITFQNRSNVYRNLLTAYRRWINDLPSDIRQIRQIKFNIEKDELENIGIGYTHFDLKRREFSIDWEFVERAVDFFESIPSHTWVHFHCARGRGRTSTLTMLYDIFHNWKTARLEEIYHHHYCLGGEDVTNTVVRPGGTWRKDNLVGRKRLIETFYDYMSAPDGYPHKKWSKWLDDHNIPLHFTLAENG